jgi:Asp-tRNA(Asn)/Glu-tRNA(Gln) amidotransferase A subunit family amidase
MAGSRKELPIGVQIVGPRWSEPRLISLCKKLILVGGNFSPPPKFSA